MNADRKPETCDVPAPSRRPYISPALEPLGPWRALTLQVTVTLEGYLEQGQSEPGSFA